MNTHELTFTLEKETKNTVRYKESVGPDAAAVVGTLYIQKTAAGSPLPQEISVTIGVAVSA